MVCISSIRQINRSQIKHCSWREVKASVVQNIIIPNWPVSRADVFYHLLLLLFGRLAEHGSISIFFTVHRSLSVC